MNDGVHRAADAVRMREHAHAVAVLRLVTIPFAVVGSFGGDGPALDRPLFVVLAALGFAYASGVWAYVQGGGTPGRAFAVVDVVGLLVFVLAADPRVDPAGRLPILLLVAAWALTAGPLTVLVRGLVVGTAILVLQLLLRGGAPDTRVLASACVISVMGAAVAYELRRRDSRSQELEARADELVVEVGDLERHERERIAQLVHDDALQRLLAARQDLDHGLEAGDEAVVAHARAGLAAATAALRDLTRVVHDEALEAAGLQAAVERLVRDVADRAGLRWTAEVDPDVCGDANATVLAVVRELAANVARHAGATSIAVAVRRRGEGVGIVVQDDGRGITAQDLRSAEAAGHLGHAALRRRIARLNGSLTVDGTPGAGTRVEVLLADADVRARRALEQTLRHERAWNAALVAGFPDPFVVSTPDLRLVDVSDRFVELTGFSRAELLSAPPGDLPYWPREDRSAIRAFASGLNDELDHEVRFDIVCKDGRRLDVLATATIVVDPRGGRNLQLITFKDLSDRKGVRGRLAEVTAGVPRRVPVADDLAVTSPELG
jgi:PAS domain S-box-containing protein